MGYLPAIFIINQGSNGVNAGPSLRFLPRIEDPIEAPQYYAITFHDVIAIRDRCQSLYYKLNVPREAKPVFHNSRCQTQVTTYDSDFQTASLTVANASGQTLGKKFLLMVFYC